MADRITIADYDARWPARFAEERSVGWIELKTFVPNEEAMGFWRALGFHPRVVQLTAPSAVAARRAAGQ